MLSRIALAVAFAMSALVLGQIEPKDGLGKRKAKTPTAVGNAPVTQAEAAAVFTRAEKVLRPVLSAAAPKSAVSIVRSDKPVTRAEVVREMGRLYDLAAPSFKITPRKIRFDAKMLTLQGAARARLEKLIAWGFVSRLGPLAAGKRETLTVQEFGDALGYFLLRTAQLTHLPSSKFTPGLMGG